MTPGSGRAGKMVQVVRQSLEEETFLSCLVGPVPEDWTRQEIPPLGRGYVLRVSTPLFEGLARRWPR